MTACSDTCDDCLQWHVWWLPIVAEVMTAYSDRSDGCLQSYKW